jgi:predicted RNA-binding protein YlqC (UPF0109 family)
MHGETRLQMPNSVEEMRQMLTALAREMVGSPEDVTVETVGTEHDVTLRVRVAPADVDRVSGPNGRSAHSLKTILAMFGVNVNPRYNIEIVSEQ